MKKIFIIFALILTFLAFNEKEVEARKVNIIVNGKDITNKAKTVIERDRLLVPVRFVSEALGKEVKWLEFSKEVVVEDITGKVTLKLGSHLIELTDGSYYLSDVPAMAFNERTYVPVRVIAEAFGMEVSYDEPSNTVSIGEGNPRLEDSYEVLGFSDELNNITTFSVNAGKNLINRITTTKLFVLDPLTKKGFINDVKNGNEVTYVPWNINDFKIILVASYDINGNIVAGRGRKIWTKVVPEVSLTGISEGETYTSDVSVMPKLNFVANSITYKVTDTFKNVTETFENKDPFGEFPLNLNGGEEKTLSITAIAEDLNGNKYESNPVSIFVATPRKLELIGVKAGDVINSTRTINVRRNFDVKSTRYYLEGPLGDLLLAEKPYGSHVFNPGAHISGDFNLRAEVELPNGEVLSTESVPVSIKGGKRLLLQGIGPKAVINDSVELYYDSNVEITSIEYVLKGNKNIRIPGAIGAKTTFKPTKEMDGSYNLYAEAKTNDGNLKSEVIKVRIHTGKLFKARPVVEKDKFIDKFAPMAINAFRNTNMAASIQMAQAILETGWGQYVPVDKYSGKTSKNLFGIKGKASNGSVTSNTWEEYNGIKYRIDDFFRAYNTLEESWSDHKALLLTKERYGIFRDVMFDPIRGAYAIRRAGYATDSAYPGKLISIINKYNLRKFDEVDFNATFIK